MIKSISATWSWVFVELMRAPSRPESELPVVWPVDVRLLTCSSGGLIERGLWVNTDIALGSELAAGMLTSFLPVAGDVKGAPSATLVVAGVGAATGLMVTDLRAASVCSGRKLSASVVAGVVTVATCSPAGLSVAGWAAALVCSNRCGSASVVTEEETAASGVPAGLDRCCSCVSSMGSSFARTWRSVGSSMRG